MNNKSCKTRINFALFVLFISFLSLHDSKFFFHIFEGMNSALLSNVNKAAASANLKM